MVKEQTLQKIFTWIVSIILGVGFIWLIQFFDMSLDRYAIPFVMFFIFLWYQTFMRYFERVNLEKENGN